MGIRLVQYEDNGFKRFGKEEFESLLIGGEEDHQLKFGTKFGFLFLFCFCFCFVLFFFFFLQTEIMSGPMTNTTTFQKLKMK